MFNRNQLEKIRAALRDTDMGEHNAHAAALDELDPHQFTRLGMAAAYFRAAQTILKNALEEDDKL